MRGCISAPKEGVWESESTAPLTFLTSELVWISGQLHAPVALPVAGTEEEAGWGPVRAGLFTEGINRLFLPGIEKRFPGCTAHKHGRFSL
jgi:hypothetical protein